MPIQSPYRRGADDGFWFGLYLTAMFFSSIFAPAFPLLSFVSLAMMVCVPLVIYRFMLRFDRQLGAFATFPMLWMQGVVIFFCGMLIASFAMVVYMKWIEPDYIVNQIQQLADMKGTAPGTVVDDAADVAEKMIEANFIPTPIAIMVEFMMLAIVTGSILSILLSLWFALRRRNRPADTPLP